MSRYFVFAPALLLCAPLLTAQQTPPATAINLDVVVTPKSGAPVAGLQQKDFTILDNKTPRPITSFHAEGGPQSPIHVIIVLDAVNVPYESIAFSRGEIEKYLHEHGGNLSFPTQMAFFLDNGIQIQEGFSTNGNELSSSVEQYKVPLRDVRRSSQFEASDRFNISLNAIRLLAQNEAKLPGRKLVLWISPGWPLLSGPGIDLDAKQQNELFATVVDLSARMRAANITLYNVNPIGAGEGVERGLYYQNFLKGVSKPGQVQIGDLSLQVLAMQSGGLTLYGSNSIVAQLQQCVADGSAYYELSFAPPTAAHSDDYHQIEVKVSDPGYTNSGYTVRTRNGYYAQP